MHTYIINYRSHSGSRFGLSLVGDSGWGPPFLSSSSMGEGKMQSVSFQDQPAVADDDEATERPTAVAEKEQPQVKLPWRQWRSGIGSSMGDTEDDKSAAVAVLNSFHGNFVVDLEPIEMWQRAGRNYVTATRTAKPGDVMLPPCFPKQSKVLERSEHPYAVEMALRVVRPTETQVGDDTTMRRSTLFLNPEFKIPNHQEVNAAVAEAKGGDDGSDDGAVADEWIWGPLVDETMHPFWAVRRDHARLQAFLRSRGFPQWFTVTVGRKGSYREHDIIAFLQKHLEPWRPGRDWRILLCDDYSAHKSINVWNLCWSRGYIRLCHGGGTTPVVQPPDTDLNQHVRREYGKKEAHAAAAATHAAAVTDD